MPRALNYKCKRKNAQHVATGAYSIDSQSESEDDDYLAAAVAAVDAQQGQGKVKKVKHPHLRALRSKLGSISRGKDREGSGGGSTHAASPTSQQVDFQFCSN